MMHPVLILVPFAIVLVAALLVPRKHARELGYLGLLAGIATVVLATVMPRGVSRMQWFSAAGQVFEMSFWVDPLSILLAIVVGGIGLFVFWYSTGYFGKREDLNRYYFLLSLFAFSMLGVVLSANLFQLFFFWELVGASSFLLIGFWHSKERAARAAGKAFITIIVGDALFLAGIALLWVRYGTFDIPAILDVFVVDTITLLAGIGLLAGALSKSAQFPFHDWLPDAMEGPTPVSTFLHSATMVKAGLFLIARFLPVLLAVGLGRWMMLVAVITILISACIALVEFDIKRVLAYSTMNQLAFILLAFSVGSLTAGLYHLVTHSVFKALLFFSSGIAIHAAGTQDLRKMKFRLSWDAFTISTLVGVLALAGVIPFSGFFSKEAIFEGLIGIGHPELVIVFLLAVFLSAAYIFRWCFLLFARQGARAEANLDMLGPLPILAIFSIVGGLMTAGFFRVWGADIPHYFGLSTWAGFLFVVLGFFVTFMVYFRGTWNVNLLSRSAMAEAFRERFLMSALYGGLGKGVLLLARLAVWIDGMIIDRTVRGIGHVFCGAGQQLRKMQAGSIAVYLFALLLGFLVLVVSLEVVP